MSQDRTLGLKYGHDEIYQPTINRGNSNIHKLNLIDFVKAFILAKKQIIIST